jgi:bifunctional UDP-N-acetylglucosamine pyrophosphorylase/glucosamine-1-phosphate N-acetyltransferase
LSVHSEQAPSPVAAVVILAAGEGKRMKSSRSKLLHEIAGHSMLSYAVTAATEVQPEHVVVVVGHLRDQVEEHLAEVAPHVLIAVQEEQLGTGHAVQVALGQMAHLDGDVIVTSGDVPMLTGETLAALLGEHRSQQAAVTVLTAEVPDPTGYGRILRDPDGMVNGIVEHRDANEVQQQITEINSGIYVFDGGALRAALSELAPLNDQGELYLSDVPALVRRAGKPVAALLIEDLWQTEGVNDRIQLSRMNAEVNRRILHRWMREGGDSCRSGDHLGTRLS